MKKEIGQVVNGLRGFLKRYPENPGANHASYWNYEIGEVKWTVTLIFAEGHQAEPMQVGIDCKRTGPRAFLMVDVGSMPLENVQLVHESLNGFLEAVIENLPKLKDMWKPLITASEYKF